MLALAQNTSAFMCISYTDQAIPGSLVLFILVCDEELAQICQFYFLILPKKKGVM